MQIRTSKGTITIDDDEAQRLLEIALTIDAKGYAKVRGSMRIGEKPHHLHRVIMNTPEGMHTDHINGDKLDNRKSNLRVCTLAENIRNRKPRQGTRSGYKGVCWKNSTRSWQAKIQAHGKRYLCGASRDPIKAAKKYDRKAKELHGEFARLNFKCGCWLEDMCQECGGPAPWKREG